MQSIIVEVIFINKITQIKRLIFFLSFFFAKSSAVSTWFLVAKFLDVSAILELKINFIRLLTSQVTINLLVSSILLSAPSVFFFKILLVWVNSILLYNQFVVFTTFNNIIFLLHCLAYLNDEQRFLADLHLNSQLQTLG